MGKLDLQELLKSFIQEEPHNPFNHYALALEIREKDPLQAIEIFDFVLEKFPDYLPTYFPAAQLFFEENQLEKAKSTYEKGIELAKTQNESKALKELQNAFQNFLFETDMD